MATRETLHHADYQATLPYSGRRTFELPRVQIPPPELDYQGGRPIFRVITTTFTHISNHYGDPAFLKALAACHPLDMSHSMLSWQYEMRRTAQKILPFLLLGPSNVARDPAFIADNGVTLLVAARCSRSVVAQPNFLDPARFPSSRGLATLTFDFDHPSEFIPRLRPVVKAINDHLQASCTRWPVESVDDVRGKALVFCESGNERSSVVVAAYLMAVFGVTAVSAIHVIQSQRFCINVSDEMKNVLVDLQAIFDAERQVSTVNAAVANINLGRPDQQMPSDKSRGSTKRGIDNVYDTDDDGMDGVAQAPPVATREGVAPFIDRPR